LASLSSLPMLSEKRGRVDRSTLPHDYVSRAAMTPTHTVRTTTNDTGRLARVKATPAIAAHRRNRIRKNWSYLLCPNN
jgi:hypothetical protein